MIDVDRGWGALLMLFCAGSITGAASLWFFLRSSDALKLRLAINGVMAHLFEFHLFGDEPMVLLCAQRDLIVANGRLLRVVLVPSLLSMIPTAVVLMGTDALFGHAPLKPGQATTLTVEYRSALPDVSLKGSAAMRVDTQPVLIPDERSASWRVRPADASLATVQILSGAGELIKQQICSLPDYCPLEIPVFHSAIRRISIQYPRATVFHFHWLLWFALASAAGASVFGIVRKA